MASYKNIEFAKGYNSSFADFKKEFGKAKVFRDMDPKLREKELNKAWKIACVNNIEVKAKEVKPDGNIVTATKKNRKSNSRKDS